MCILKYLSKFIYTVSKMIFSLLGFLWCQKSHLPSSFLSEQVGQRKNITTKCSSVWRIKLIGFFNNYPLKLGRRYISESVTSDLVLPQIKRKGINWTQFQCSRQIRRRSLIAFCAKNSRKPMNNKKNRRQRCYNVHWLENF